MWDTKALTKYERPKMKMQSFSQKKTAFFGGLLFSFLAVYISLGLYSLGVDVRIVLQLALRTLNSRVRGLSPIAVYNQLLPLLYLQRFSEFESLQKISGPSAIYGKFHNWKLSLGRLRNEFQVSCVMTWWLVVCLDRLVKSRLVHMMICSFPHTTTYFLWNTWKGG